MSFIELGNKEFHWSNGLSILLETLSRHIFFGKMVAMFEGRIYGGFSGQEVLLVTNFLRRKMKQSFSDNRPWSHATVTPSPNMVKHGWCSVLKPDV